MMDKCAAMHGGMMGNGMMQGGQQMGLQSSKPMQCPMMNARAKDKAAGEQTDHTAH
jgi:hypothetical protein